MKKPLLLHPFLFALYPVLFVYSQNLEQMSLSEVWVPALTFAGCTALILLPLALILHDARRAGAVLALFLILFFSYGPVNRLLAGTRLAAGGNWPVMLLAACGVLFAAATALILRSKQGWQEITRILNLMALVLVASALFSIVLYEVQNRGTAKEVGSTPVHITPRQPLAVERLPDIYYIILDGYARTDVLQDLYSYDNASFLNFLTERGFYVATRSRANYAHTVLSLASALNLRYLDEEARRIGLDTQDRAPMAELIANNEVLGFLKQLGYGIVAFPTDYAFSDLAQADVYLGGSVRRSSDLELGLLLMTPVPWLVLEDSRFRAQAGHVAHIRYILDHLADTAELESPRFVFAHIVAPHPPFVLDAEGNEITPKQGYSLGDGSYFRAEGGTYEEYVAGYTDQLTFITRRIEAILDELLAQTSHPTVIILQADHGPGSRLDWASLEGSDLRERLSILNAYLLPGEEPTGLYPEITPVNTFRLVLNRYFGTELELLEDRSYFSTWERPYRFIDVTDRVD